MPQHEQTPGPSQSQATEIGLREFFCNFLQSQAPTQSKTTNRKKRVASLGESLTEKQAITRLSYIYIYIYICISLIKSIIILSDKTSFQESTFKNSPYTS